VELGEIEAILHLHPQIREAVVILNDNVPDQDRLVAYIVPKGLPMPAVGDIRDFLRQRLPQYMVPTAFVLLSSLPRTPHGKLDRRALPAPETSRSELKEIFVAPQGSVEEALAKIWTKILGIQEIGVNDNFFDLGGHSLMATQVISRLRDIFQIELPLRSLFESPTIAALAEVIHKAKDSGPNMSIPTILPVARDLYRTTLTADGILRAPERLKSVLLA
jgi:acyl carrier protein